MTKFRDDIVPEKTWLWSDTHFGHSNIIGYSHRPPDFESIMLEEAAQEVPVADDIRLIHLGDLVYTGNAMFRAVTSKHLPAVQRDLILGNHDKGRYSYYRKCGFRVIRPFSIMWGDTEVSFNHYPWNTDRDGPMPENHLRLHGHIHNSGYTRSGYVPFLKNHVNLSVEQTKYKPVNLGSLLSAVLDGRYAADDGNPTAIDADAIRKEVTAHVQPNQ